MTPIPEVQERLRRYLLGQLTDDTREEVEKDLLAGAEVFEELLVVEDELVDQYLNESLEAADRSAFENHFLATPERQDKLRFGRAFNRYLSSQASAVPARETEPAPSNWAFPKTIFSSPLRIGVFALVVIGIVFGVWRIFLHQSEVDKGLLALNAAYREQRPLESRISALSYAPYPKTRGPNEARRFDSLARTRAEAILTNAVNENADGKTHHALGQVFLANRQFDEAIQQFDDAVKTGSRNPRLYSDLGAAWLEKGKLEERSAEPGKGASDLARALASLNKALELDSQLLEARFNRALCLQLMKLPEQAENEWREYLKRDSKSQWADEAARNLKDLEERKSQTSTVNPVAEFLRAYQSGDDESAWRLISRHRDLSGGPVANTLIDNYLELSARHQPDQSKKALDALSYAAKLEKDRAGDLFVQDVVRQLSVLTEPQRNSMFEARRLLKLGQENLLQSNSDVAIKSLTQAKDLFEQLGSKSEAIYVEYPIGHFLLAQKKSDQALVAFKHVVSMSQAQQYKWLMAQALNATANTQIGLTNHSAALEASEASLALSKEIGDTTGVMKTTTQLASEYFRLGNYPKSLDLHQQSLATAYVMSPEPMQFWRSYFGIAMPLEALGLHAAAIEYEKEALRRAQAMKQANEISRSYSVLGLMYAGEGNYQEAIRSGEAAIAIARAIPSERARQEAVAYSMLQLGLIYRESGDPGKAIANYDQAIESYRSLDRFEAFSYVAHKGKLLSCISKPGCGFAEEEIKTCLDLFQRFRTNIREVSNRLPFFDTEQDIFDIATEYQFSRQNYQLSFEYSEQSRASTLRELAQSKAKLIQNSSGPDIELKAPTQTMSFGELQASIPTNAQVLQYAVLPDKIVLWLISSTEFTHEEKAIRLEDLNGILDRYLRLVSSPSSNAEDVSRDGSALYEILIRPIERRLIKDRLLCIVPDKRLNYLPFAALVPAAGTYLIDEFRIVMAPSATMFVTSSVRASQREGVASESLLTVGNPRFDRVQFSQLDDLPSAEKEAREIKRFYEGSRASVLVGSEAVKSLVTAQMRQADVVHLALHSIVDEQSPFRSRLILAEPGNHDRSDEGGVLQAYEIYGAGMPVTRLVVLSACETATGRDYGGEGTTGLSQTFIASGVPLVVASLWKVDSDAAADLMIDFHRLRKTEKLPSADALQKAQQHMANGQDVRHRQPYYWAAFNVTGGYATF